MRFAVAFLLVAGLWLGPAVSSAWAQGRADTLRPPDGAPPDLAAFRDTLDLFQNQPFRLRPFVLPGSERVFVSGTALDTSAYRLDYREGRLWLERLPRTGDATLVVRYQTFPFPLKSIYRRRGIVTADSAAAAGSAFAGRRVVEEAQPDSARFNPFAGVTLERSGSISRGVLAGSNRDVAVESGLRMQLSGEITEGVNVRAVLTDENTPIQPEGTTQRLDDFDRVFVEIDAPPGTARLGDVELDFAGTEFAAFSREVQGAALSSAFEGTPTGALGGGAVTLAGATTRGAYRAQDIQPLDGVQGPYRLEGNEGERFIIVLAGTETVYLDGQRLERGETNDYTIDYAQAEITFTANRLVTADRRITVEFEYAASRFTRTLVAAQGQAGFWPRRKEGGDPGEARLEIGAAFLREADGDAFGAALELTRADSAALAGAGDALAMRSGAERVPFDPEARYVQYVREARPQPGGAVDSAFVALETTPPDSAAVFRVRFTRVGEGQGRYERVGQSANGVRYAYRGPGQGSYDPVRRLPRPAQQRLVDLTGRLRPWRGLELFGEWAQSLRDENRLSALDAADDRGGAYLAGMRLVPTSVEVGGAEWGKLSGEVRRRVTGANFSTFNRTRPVEFERRWNLGALSFDPTGGVEGLGDEAVDEAALQFDLAPGTGARGEVGRLSLGETFEAVRRQISFTTGAAGLPRADYRAEYITSTDRQRALDGAWLRQRGAVRQPLLGGRLTPRLEVEHERRRQRALDTDRLAPRSFSFVELRPGVSFEAGRLEAGGEVEVRREDEAAGGVLLDAATAYTVQTNAAYDAGRTFATQAKIGYRVRRFTDYFRANEDRENTEAVLVQSKTRYRPFDEAVEIDAFYEALTERTPTLQEIYVRTGPELGQYIWQDANDDGFRQIDEFVPEPTPNEGTYVQTFVPSDELEPVIDVQARARLRLDPGRAWRGAAARWKRLLARVQTQTTAEVREKSRAGDLASIYLLNLSRFRDPATTQTGRLRVAQEVNFFRREARYGLGLSFETVESLSRLSASTEARSERAWQAEGRYRPSAAWDVRLAAALETEAADSRFESRRYQIRSVEVQPEVAYRFSPAVQLSGGASFAQKEDAVGGRRARLVKAPLEARFSAAQRLGLTARAEAAHVELEGAAVGLAQFALTDGRGPGTSYLWSLSGQYAFTSYLRLSLAYDGRAPAGAPAINTLRLELSADF